MSLKSVSLPVGGIVPISDYAPNMEGRTGRAGRLVQHGLYKQLTMPLIIFGTVKMGFTGNLPTGFNKMVRTRFQIMIWLLALNFPAHELRSTRIHVKLVSNRLRSLSKRKFLMVLMGLVVMGMFNVCLFSTVNGSVFSTLGVLMV